MLHAASLALHPRHPHTEEAEEKATEQVLQSNTTSVKSYGSRKESAECFLLIDLDGKAMETVLHSELQ